MYNFKTKLVCLTSAAALAISGINVPNMQVTSYAEEAIKPVVPEKAKGWTFGLYLCGQNLESWGNAATEDVMEILKADVPEGFSKDNNIIIETGGCYDWHFKEEYSKYLRKEKKLSKKEIAQVIPEEIDPEKISQYKVNFEFEYVADDGTKKTVPTLEFVKDVAEYNPELLDDSEDDFFFNMGKKKAKNSPDDLDETDITNDDNYADMGNEKFLREFINDLDTEYPAEHMAVDLWNHGGGITGGVCYDQYTEDPITLAEIKNILSDRKKAGFDKIDIFGYDACLMSNYETWVNLSAYVDYGVGSLTSEPGDGWYYTPFFTELGANYTDEKYTAADFASSIVDAYKEFYQNAGKENPDEEDIDNEDVDNEDVDDDDFYDDDFDEEDDYYASAVLCAVDLNKLALSAAQFKEIGDNLFKAYVDAEGVKSIFTQATETGCVEEMYEIVELSKFLDAIKDIAPERMEALTGTTDPYEMIAMGAYQNAMEKVDDFKESVNASLVNAYNGYESHQFYDSLAMSIFVPDEYADSDIPEFNADIYPEYSVCDSYARLTYLIASKLEIKDVQNIEFNPQYKYDASLGLLSLSLTEEEREAIYDSNAFTYAEVKGKNFLVNNNYSSSSSSDEDSDKVLNFKVESGFYSLDGKTPIYASTKNEVVDGIDSQIVNIMGYLNDTYGSFTFLNDTKTGDLFFEEFESYDEDYYYDDDYMLAKKKFQKKVLDKVSKKVLAKAKNDYDEDDYYDDDFDDNQDWYRSELKPGDVIKLEGMLANEVKYMGSENGDYANISEVVSDSYTIKETDKKKFTHQVGEDYEVTVKRYTPDIKFVKAEGDKCNVAIGYEIYDGYDEDDYFFFGALSEDDDDELNEDIDNEDIDEDDYDDNFDEETIEAKIINIGRMKAFANSNISVEKAEYELTGEAITPKLIFDEDSAKLVEGEDYTLAYEDNIGLGVAKAVLTPIGDLDFLDVRTVEFKIVKAKVVEDGTEKIVYVTVYVNQPKQAKVKSVKNNKNKAFTVKWKKVKGAKGYQVKYALNKKFTKGKKVKTIKNAKKLSLTVKKLKKKTYYVKVRAFTKDQNGKRVYGDWSKVKKVKIKK